MVVIKIQKCKNCGAKVIKFPLWEIEGDKKVFLWKNLFKMSIDSIILLVVLAALIVSYNIDTEKCKDMIRNPLGYCEETNACKVLAEEQFKQDNIKVPSIDDDIKLYDLDFINDLET